MKKPNIVVLIMCLTTFTLSSYAQTFEIKAGVNMSTMLFENQGGTYSENFELTPRFLLGATTELPLSNSFSFEPGVFFSSSGYKIDSHYPVPTYSGEYIPIREQAILNYIEIPASLRLASSIKNIQLFGNIGPYLAIGLSGKVSRKEYRIDGQEGVVYEGTIDYSGEIGNDGQWKRFDYGFQAGIGVEVNRIVVRGNYKHGIANIAQDSGIKNKNRVFAISLGYILGLKK
ncbi:porin family protein [Maribellus maritimus]|uniref:porin family protein n=1 Tax=Maribellus maritimus TaxID=2870838 RepID=UPI001EEADEAB|nr:porin family protein [Maribellus maritimus]MCG6190476.1 PorT family protein [Maribellus maritimus]